MTTVDLRFGDCLAVLRQLEDESISAVVTDPPYELNFMGRAWDASGIAYNVEVWRECLRVTKPGGHLAAFGGTRTFHRMAVAIEDAGWEIRDSIGLAAWVQGQGFPKGKDQLKPAWEPITLARKPFRGSAKANIAKHGTGGINVDACRVGTGGQLKWSTPRDMGYYGDTDVAGSEATANEQGRWPANVVLSHADTCEDGGACAGGCPVAELDRQSGITLSQGGSRGASRQRSSMEGGVLGAQPDVKPGFGDEGGASRFFPVFRYQAKAPTRERPKIDGKGWPTVKPLALMRWLVRLVTPPGGVVLDPFAGTGSTLQAARDEGFASIGVERDEFAYLLACRRLGLPELVPVTDVETGDPVALPEVEVPGESVVEQLPEPVDPVLAAIAAASSYDELLVLWREHRWGKDSDYNTAAAARRAELEGAAA